MICILFDLHVSRMVIKEKNKMLRGTLKLFDIFALITFYKK